MALQTQNTAFSPSDAYDQIRSNAIGVKAQAQNALATLQAGSVNSDFVFRMLDQLITIDNVLTSWKAVAGLDTYATAQGYTGSMVSDCNAVIAAGQACIAWVVANFPSSAGFMQAYTLNADGTRTPRSFTSAATAGLQSALLTFIGTIG